MIQCLYKAEINLIFCILVLYYKLYVYILIILIYYKYLYILCNFSSKMATTSIKKICREKKVWFCGCSKRTYAPGTYKKNY